MQFTKSELSFLNIYNQSVDNLSFSNNKIEIFHREGKTYFLLRKIDSGILNFIEKEVSDSSIRVVFELNQFFSLVNSCSESDVITITDTGIVINDKAVYDLENFTVEFDEGFFNIIKDVDSKIIDTITLENLDEISFCKNFMGQDNLDTIAIFNSYLIASNQASYSCLLKSSTTFANDMYIPGEFIQILINTKTNDKEISFSLTEDFFVYNVETLKVIVAKKDDYILPNLRNENHVSMYDFDNEIVCNSNDFLSSLKRLNTVSQAKYGNRIFVKFENNKIFFNNVDVINAKEEFDMQYPAVLEGQQICISVTNLIKAISSLKLDTFKMKVSSDLSESFICTICNESEEKYILLNLYE